MRARAGFIRILVATVVALNLGLTPNARAQSAPEHRPGEVLVKFRKSASPAAVSAISAELGSDLVESFPRLGIERLRVTGSSVEDAVARLRSDPAVEFAEPNYIYHASTLPNDPGFPQLWGLLNTGQTGGTPGDDIHAAQAWSTFTGSPGVLVGVIDTGADYTHPDLAANMFLNPGEIPGNGIDDDGNGFIDDVHGWDFANHDNDPMDDHYHGTHVSGTIGAVGNNGVGVVGVNWNVRILPIKFLDAGGSGSTDEAIHSIEYATMMGVSVINASWGGGGYSESLRLAIAAAGEAGVLFVAAAGNSGVDTDVYPNYPSAYDLDNIVAVAATDANDQLAYFSNYGMVSVDLAAPGVAVYSTMPGSNYGLLSGTSMATPHVVGVAALIRGRFPAATVAMTKALLLERAQPRPGLAGRVKTGARLDALMALSDPDSIPPAPVLDLATSDPGGSRMGLHWTATGDDGSSGTAFAYDVRYSTAPITAQNFAAATPASGEPAPLPAGSAQQMVVSGLAFSTDYHFALRALDEFGNASDVSNDVAASTLGPPDIAIAPDSLSESLHTGETSTQSLTVVNSGVSDLAFAVRREGDAAGMSIEVITGGAGVPATVLARGRVVPLASLTSGGMPIARTVQVGDGGPPDRLGVIRPGSITPGPIVHAPSEEVFGSTANVFTGSPRTRGNIFQCTTARTLHEHRLYLSPYGTTQLWFLVYEGAAAAGNYTLVSASNVSPAGPGTGWYSSGEIDLPLTEGRYYLIVASFDQLGDYYNQTAISPYPIPASFGSLICGAGWFWAPSAMFPPAPFQDVPAEAFGDAVAYYQTLVTDDRFTWISAVPESATVPAGGQLAVAAHFDAAGMNDGDYDARLVFESNDPDEPALPIPVHLHVTGAPDIAVAPDSLDFGPLFLGAALDDTVLVRNTGTAQLNIAGVSALPGDFTVDPAGFALAPGAQRKLAVRFAPASASAITGSLTLSSDDPDEPLITVFLAGQGLVAPDIDVAPDSLSADLLTGEQATRTVTVANTGGSDLTFRVSITGELPGANARIVITPPEPGPGEGGGPAAPSARSDQAPAAYQLLASPHTRTAGAHVLLIQDYLPWGTYSNNQVLAANGIAFDAIGSSQLPGVDLAAYEVVIVASDQPTSTYLNLAARAAQIDSFVLQGGSLEFHAAGFGYAGGDPSVVTLPGGMHTALYYSTLNYVLMPGHPVVAGVPNPFFGNGASHGYFTAIPAGADLIASDELGRPNLVEYPHGAGRVIAAAQTLEAGYAYNEAAGLILKNLIPYVAHGGAGWLDAEPLAGTIPAGGSATLTVTFDATGLLGGDYRGAVRVRSNDPDESPVDVPAQLHVTGVPRIAVLGQKHEIQSSQTYAVSNASTHHTLPLPTVPASAGNVRLDIDGDYGNFGETATLLVEGVNLGFLGEIGIDCAPDSAGFPLTDAQLQQFAADQSVVVTVANSPTVDAFCQVNRHTVRFGYRDPGDTLAFGLRLIGSCRSESLEVSNPGTDTLIVSGITSNSALFVVGASSLRVGPGASAPLGVTFCPIATGGAVATLTIHSNDPAAGTVSVALTGAGAVAPDIAIEPAALSVEMLSNQTATRTLTISNTGGPLLWTAAASVSPQDSVVETSPVFKASPGDRVSTESAHGPGPRDPAREYASAAAPSGGLLEPLPVPGPPTGNLSLEAVLASLDAHFGGVTAAIPNRYDFSEGVFGNVIVDGGGNMYDYGNYLGTNLASYIDYSDGVIRNHYAFGPAGRYFTRKYPGLFVLAADLDGANTFQIDGSLGNAGLASVDGSVLDAGLAGGYRAFVKRVFNSGNPSVNHMVIVPDGGGAAHAFSYYGGADYHSVTGVAGHRIYYLLYAGANGGYIDNAASLQILDKFLAASGLSGGSVTVNPANGGVPGGGSVAVEVTFDSEGLFGGDYDGQVVVMSNDPDENPVVIPTHMHVIGVPDIAVVPDSIAFGAVFVGGARSDTVVVRNVGTTDLNVSGVSATPGAFTVDPSGFVLGPGGQRTLLVGFAPSAVGPAVGTLAISSDDPDEALAAVQLVGLGLVPPDIAVSPDSLRADVPIGAQATRTLTLTNTGGSDLMFQASVSGEIPGDSLRVMPAAAARGPAESGSSAGSQSAPAGYQPSAPASVMTAGARVLLIQDYLPWGSNANAQILVANGIPFDIIASSQLAFTNLAAYRDVIVASDQQTFTYQTLATRAAQIEDFVLHGGSLEFHAAGWGWNSGNASLVTLPGGVHIAAYSSSVNSLLLPGHPIVAGVPNPFTGSSASHAYFTNLPAGAERIVQDDVGHPNLISYRHGAGVVVAAGQTLEFGYDWGQGAGIILRNLIPYVAEGGVSWLSVEPSAGTVPAGGSLALTVTFDATGLEGGDHRAAVRIDSNDPDENPVSVPAHLYAIGVPNIVVTPTALNFGSVFIGAVRQDTVAVRNSGTGPLTVSAVTLSPGVFTADTSGFVLAPGARRTLVVSFAPTATGPVSGSIAFVSDDPDEGLAGAALAGVGLVPPNLDVSPDSLSADLPVGGQATRTLTLANTGGSDLTFQVWISGELNSPATIAAPPDAIRAGSAEVGRSDRPPADYRPAAAVHSTMAGARVLLIQDSAPWGSEANNSVLNSNGIPFDVIGSNQLAATDLAGYRDLIVAGDQPSATYLTLAARAAQIDSFVTHGGRLEFHAAGWGFAGGNPTVVTLPGGMHIVNSYSGLNYVLLPGHPIMAGVPNPFTGSLASHAAFSSIPAGADLIVRDDLGLPNLVSYRHGFGRVFASGQTLERGFSYGEPAGLILRNLIPYVARGGVSWLTAQPLQGTVPAGGSAEVTLTFDATGLAGGDYRSTIEIDSNDPDQFVVKVPAHLTVLGAAGLLSVADRVAKFELAPVVPTPARGTAAIEFELTRPGNAQVTIYDVAGRKVRTLAAGPHAAGRHQLAWRGEDDHGASRGAGIYLLRLETEEGRRTRRLVWVP